MTGTFQLEKVDSVPSLKARAYSAIKEAILSLGLEPGAPLVEGDLARQLGISKTPVRDALQVLEREGFVTRVQFRGTFVTEVSVPDIMEVFQCRAALEGLAARLSAPHLSDAQLEWIDQELTAAEAALAGGDLALCSQRGQCLHNTLIERAGNARLTAIIHHLDDHVRRFRMLSDRIEGRLGKSVLEHRAVLEGLRRRDPAQAEAAMRNHLFSVLQDLSEPGDS